MRYLGDGAHTISGSGAESRRSSDRRGGDPGTQLRVLEQSTDYAGKVLPVLSERAIIGHDDESGFRFEDVEGYREWVGDAFDAGHRGRKLILCDVFQSLDSQEFSP